MIDYPECDAAERHAKDCSCIVTQREFLGACAGKDREIERLTASLDEASGVIDDLLGYVEWVESGNDPDVPDVAKLIKRAEAFLRMTKSGADNKGDDNDQP